MLFLIAKLANFSHIHKWFIVYTRVHTRVPAESVFNLIDDKEKSADYRDAVILDDVTAVSGQIETIQE